MNALQKPSHLLSGTVVLERLEYIRQTIWRCGQIDRYQRKVKSQGDSEAGLQLHFEYEVLKFVVYGGYRDDDSRPAHFDPERKTLSRSTETVVLTISAVQSERDGSRQLWFADKLLSTPLSNFAALVEELDDAIYRYCQTARSPLEEKVQQDQENRQEETKYRRYKPLKRPRF